MEISFLKKIWIYTQKKKDFPYNLAGTSGWSLT